MDWYPFQPRKGNWKPWNVAVWLYRGYECVHPTGIIGPGFWTQLLQPPPLYEYQLKNELKSVVSYPQLGYFIAKSSLSPSFVVCSIHIYIQQVPKNWRQQWPNRHQWHPQMTKMNSKQLIAPGLNGWSKPVFKQGCLLCLPFLPTTVHSCVHVSAEHCD